MKITRKGFTLIELSVVIGIFLVMIGILAPFVQMARARANRINCAINLRKISLGLHAYAVDRDDVFPPNLTVLYPNYVDDEKVFDCPASKFAGTKEKAEYEYTTGLTEISGPKEIIAQDGQGNHKKAGKNILKVSGSVEWVSKRR